MCKWYTYLHLHYIRHDQHGQILIIFSDKRFPIKSMSHVSTTTKGNVWGSDVYSWNSKRIIIQKLKCYFLVNCQLILLSKFECVNGSCEWCVFCGLVVDLHRKKNLYICHWTESIKLFYFCFPRWLVYLFFDIVEGKSIAYSYQ